MTVAQVPLPKLRDSARDLVYGLTRIGNQWRFYTQTIKSIGDALIHYRVELLRLIAQMSLGTGALAVIGGTVVVVGFLTMTTGALIAVQGYSQFAEVGVEALVGFASAYFNVRLAAPLVAALPWPPPSAPVPPRRSGQCGSTKKSTRSR